MTAIEFEHISKQYRLGLVSTRTLSHDLNRWWQTSVLRREDPYLRIGETNDRATKGESEYVWALRDIDFKVEQGDVVGIIGKNGAGKSTLLKLLSRVTAPTTGTIRARGRIASLLEVGTGFHGEMTGRENIYLNGAIMGMTKQEINRKLDEIVDFSGCERYLDTPVKRYSSGMTVRLGFAVAAHLDPEILVVDEVLAVGDAEFQKKAIGKMQDISHGEGRTVLFVSHNMASVRALCKHGVILQNGGILANGEINDIIDIYMEDSRPIVGYDLSLDNHFEGSGELRIGKVNINSVDNSNGYVINSKSAIISVEILNPLRLKGLIELAGVIKNSERVYINYFGTRLKRFQINLNGEERIVVEAKFDTFPLVSGKYYLGLEIVRSDVRELAYWKDTAVSFIVDEIDFYKSGDSWRKGIVLLQHNWRIKS